MKKPLVRPIPYPDESPGSLLLRASSLNGWKSITSFLAAYDVYNYEVDISSFIVNSDRWNLVIEQLGIKLEPSNYKGYTKQSPNSRSLVEILGMQFPFHDLRLKTPVICSECIRDNGYLSKFIDLKVFDYCPEHGTKLLRTCPKCNSQISWNRQDLLTCKCGHTFRSPKGNQSSIATTKYTANLINNNKIKEITLIQFRVKQVRLFVETFRLDKKFGNDYLSIAVGIITEDKNQIRKFKHAVLKMATEKGIHPRVSLFPFLNKTDTNCEAFVEKILASNKFHLASSVPNYQFNHKLTLDETSQILGIKIFLVKQLIKAEIIDLSKYKNKTKCFVTLESVNNLLALFSSEGQSSKNLLPLSKVLYQPGYGLTLISVIKDLKCQKRNYSPMLPNEGILSLRVEAYKQKNTHKDCITMKDMALLCDTTYDNIRFAVHSGIIPQFKQANSLERTIQIKVEDAIQFNDKFVFAATMAKHYSINTRTISEKLIALDGKPVSGPNIDGGLSYLFRRDDISSIKKEDLLQLKIYPTKTGRVKGGKEIISNQNSIDLKSAAKRLKLSISQINSLIKAGHLTKEENNQREVFLNIKSFRIIKSILSSKKLLTIQNAIDETGETSSAFYKRWVNTGFVKLIDVKIQKYISKADLKKIMAFKKKYVTSAEAGKIANTNRSYFPNLEKLGRIKIARTLSGEGRIIKFYSLRDVMKIIAT